jgi:hypothetical protein
MCLSGFRGTSIPVKQDLRELSPERGFKMTLEFCDAFRGVGPIKYLKRQHTSVFLYFELEEAHPETHFLFSGEIGIIPEGISSCFHISE